MTLATTSTFRPSRLPVIRQALAAALSKFSRAILATACISLAAAGVLVLRYALFERSHGGDEVLEGLLRHARGG